MALYFLHPRVGLFYERGPLVPRWWLSLTFEAAQRVVLAFFFLCAMLVLRCSILLHFLIAYEFLVHFGLFFTRSLPSFAGNAFFRSLAPVLFDHGHWQVFFFLSSSFDSCFMFDTDERFIRFYIL